MKATFENTVNILVKAYFNGTLEHNNCSACAIGNILGGREEWKYLFATNISHTRQTINYSGVYKGLRLREIRKIAVDLIDQSGYSKKELMRIEWAFETAPRTCCITDGKNEEWMFNGLMSVVDVLAEIHGIDLKAKEEAKLLFVKA